MHKVRIQPLILNGVVAVRKSGLLGNPKNYKLAARIAESLSYDETARWIRKYPELYLRGIENGFEG